MQQEFSTLMTPKDERTFELGGELFHWVTPYWEDLATIYDEDTEQLDKALARAEAEAEGRTNGTEPAPTMKVQIAKTQERIALFLPSDEKAKWKKLCGRKTDPVPIFMFGRVYAWLLEVATGRPTSPLSPSADGAGSGGASSPAGSPSQAATPAR